MRPPTDAAGAAGPRHRAGAERSGRDHAERAAYRRWLVATSLGELAGFAVPTTVWGLTAIVRLGDRAALVPVIAAGAGEGALLGYAQSLALRRELPALDRRAWVRATAAAAGVSWAIGMAPSTFHEELSPWPAPLLAVLAIVGGSVMLCSIGAAQAMILRRHVVRAERWIVANAAGWLAGLPIPFVALGLAPEDPPALRAGIAVAAGAAMGVTVAAVTGVTLVRLLRRPRTRPPAQLRRVMRVHLNHAHAWLYARSDGRLGGRVGPYPVLLLTTIGRRTGRPRRTPVQYQRIDGALVIVAAAGGAPEPPSWQANIDADARVTVQVGAESWGALAVPATGRDRAALWRRLCEHNCHLERLERKADRELAVIRLIPPSPPCTGQPGAGSTRGAASVLHRSARAARRG
jgi:deazaflavin-dependent oxidoreductase (nitroreductase family)